MQKIYKSHRHLSETQIKKRLEKQGWDVWRGSSICCTRETDVYPNVFKKYSRLALLLQDKLESLQYIASVHHGMPDFLCHRKNEFLFVECKLGHEQLSKLQKKCIIRLKELGFDVEIHKFVFNCTKTRIAYVDLNNGEKKIIDKQERLKLKYKKL